MEQNVTFLCKLTNSWMSDFQLCIPKNLKLFLLVTLNAVKETYIHLIKKWWWLYGVLVVVNGVIFSYMPLNASIMLVPLVALMLLQFIPLFVLFLTIRPSVTLKTFDYYLEYLKYYFFSYGMLIGFMVITTLIYLLRYPLLMTYSFILSPFVVIFMFFYFDSNGSIIELFVSIYRAGLMLLFHYPFLLISYLVLSGVFVATELLLQNLFVQALGETLIAQQLGVSMAIYLLVPFVFCFYNTFYIKRVHEQFNLYFPNKNV